MAANGFFGFTPGDAQFGTDRGQGYQQGNASCGVGSSICQFGGSGENESSFQGNQSHTDVLPTMSSDGNQQNGGWGSGFRESQSSRGFRGRGMGRGRGGRMGFDGTSGQPKGTHPLHCCDACRISCAGSQPYQGHLQGSKHKKKEAASKAGAATSMPKGGSAVYCELCDVACTGSDQYAAHIRGSKHQKVVKWHLMLAKPIPSHEPTIISNKEGEEGEQSSAEKYKLIGYKCKHCGSLFNDVNSQGIHLKGRRHMAQYKKKVDPTIEVVTKSMKPNKQPEPPQPDSFGGLPPGPGEPDMGFHGMDHMQCSPTPSNATPLERARDSESPLTAADLDVAPPSFSGGFLSNSATSIREKKLKTETPANDDAGAVSKTETPANDDAGTVLNTEMTKNN